MLLELRMIDQQFSSSYLTEVYKKAPPPTPEEPNFLVLTFPSLITAIVKSLTSLVSSIAETIGAALQSVYVVFRYLLYAILGTIQAIFAALWGLSHVADSERSAARPE
ncbi:hypothetical protein VE00_09561 [Pseudogymnoascus sp. WSF 3629]|nr:hypothetical protein VE00_09561 [Pseudogymnoascus sp. WSF 3629]